MIMLKCWFIFALIKLSTPVAVRKDASIVIVGGGLSGLAAADALKSKGGFTNVRILEAANRIGGRAYPVQVPNGDGFLDLGAGMLKGKEPLFSIASSLNLLAPTTTSTLQSYFYTQSQCEMSSSLSSSFNDFFDNLMTTVQGIPASTPEKPLGVLFQDAYDTLAKGSLSTSMSGGYKPFYDSVFGLVKKAIEAETGATDWNDVSREQVATAKETFQLGKKGTKGILDYYISRVSTSNIMLNSKVTKITYRNDMPVQLLLGNGQTVSADHVIVTLPVGVLKKSPQLFDPSLPTDQTDAMNKFGVGTSDKAFMIYNKNDLKFWKSDSNDINLMRVVNNPWNCNFKEKFPEENDANKIFWNLVPNQFQSNVLEASFAGGFDASRLELMAENAVGQMTTETLRRFVPLKKGQMFPSPQQVIKSNWGLSDLSFGGTSYPSVACVGQDCKTKLRRSVSVTRNGVSVPVILFAGEATDDVDSNTMNGAVNSGIREATTIMTIT